MKSYRRAVIGVVAGASLLGTFGVASATHRDTGYSPCRPGTDDLRAGYDDVKDREDPRHELPTVYANGSPDEGSTEGNIGVCGGSTDNGTAQFVEVGNDADGPYLDHSDPPADVPAATTGTPADEFGTVNVGGDYVEVDGTEGNPASEEPGHSWLDGYASVGLTEHEGEPGICMSGDNDHDYYENEQPTWKDCNEELLAGAGSELTG